MNNQLKWFKNSSGASLQGVLVRTTTFFGLDALVVQVTVPVSCCGVDEDSETRVGAGGFVGFTMSDRAWASFRAQGIVVGDLINLQLATDKTYLRDGRMFFEMEIKKVCDSSRKDDDMIDMHKVKWLKKATDTRLRGVFVGTKTTGFGIEAIIIRTRVSCMCYSDEDTLRLSGVAQTTASPGDLVGFGLTARGWQDFERQGVEVGDTVELSIHNERARDLSGSGRSVFDESLIKISSPPARVEVAPLPKSRVGWPRIVVLASDAYSSTAADGFREKAILLIAGIIDLESDRKLVDLISRAAAAKKAYDDEYVEHGCWKVGDDGESNHTRWSKASNELATAMLDGVLVTSR